MSQQFCRRLYGAAMVLLVFPKTFQLIGHQGSNCDLKGLNCITYKTVVHVCLLLTVVKRRNKLEVHETFESHCLAHVLQPGNTLLCGRIQQHRNP